MARRKDTATPRSRGDFHPYPILDRDDDYGEAPLFTDNFLTEAAAFRMLWKEMDGEETPTGQDLEEFFLEISGGIHIKRPHYW